MEGIHVGADEANLIQLACADRGLEILGDSRMPSSKNAPVWQPQL